MITWHTNWSCRRSSPLLKIICTGSRGIEAGTSSAAAAPSAATAPSAGCGVHDAALNTKRTGDRADLNTRQSCSAELPGVWPPRSQGLLAYALVTARQLCGNVARHVQHVAEPKRHILYKRKTPKH